MSGSDSRNAHKGVGPYALVGIAVPLPEGGRATDYAVATGDYIAEWMDGEGINAAELARRLDVTPKRVDELLDGSAPLNPTLARSLSRVTGVPARLWELYEAGYRSDLLDQMAAACELFRATAVACAHRRFVMADYYVRLDGLRFAMRAPAALDELATRCDAYSDLLTELGQEVESIRATGRRTEARRYAKALEALEATLAALQRLCRPECPPSTPGA